MTREGGLLLSGTPLPIPGLDGAALPQARCLPWATDVPHSDLALASLVTP